MAKNTIHIKKSKVGSLHKALGIPKGEKIPASKLAIKSGDSPAMRKKKTFAKNARKWKHFDGGTIVGNGGPSKPFVQSNTFATNATEDSHMQDIANYENLPHNKKVFIDELGKNKKPDNGDLRELIMSTLSLAPELFPSKRTPTVVEPTSTYNPFQQGTGSQAIAKAGKSVSPKKAREILRDGTAHGKRLTDAQKRYFGWIAGGGKAEAGMELFGGGEDPKAKKQPADIRTNYNIKKLPYYLDWINRSVLDQVNPATHASGTSLINEGFGKMVDAINIFNADPMYKKYSGKERIRQFFSWNSGNEEVENLKKAVNGINYSPDIDVDFTPDINVNPERKLAAQKLAKNMKSGGKIKKTENMFDGGTMEFVGPSHKNGGIDISYEGVPVNVEGQEQAFVDSSGDLNIMGNMMIPGTKMKFKKATKTLAKEEDRLNSMFEKSKGLAKGNINDKFSRLRMSTAALMADGATKGLSDIAKQKERLADIQNAMLEMANEAGIDPIAMSNGKVKKAKNGMKLKGGGDDGKKSVAQRHNNPGNIKFASWMKKYGATQGEAAKDGGYFAKFPDVNTGLTALRDLLNSKNYKGLTVEKAIERWTGGSPYKINLGELSGKKISSLDQDQFGKLVNVITMGEDSKLYGYKDGSSTSKTEIPLEKVSAPTWISSNNVSSGPRVSNNKKYGSYSDPNYPETELGQLVVNNKRLPSAADFNRVSIGDIAPEIFTIISSKQEPVPAQRYQPDLYQPYQVSFQDRLNENQSTFNAVARAFQYNPSAIGTAAAQKYAADNNVLGEEFRTNQGIANEIINKNTQLLNDAQLKNLGIADTQMVRQSTAKSKTRTQLMEAIKSIQNKYDLNELENNRIKTYEGLFDYRYSDNNQDGSPDGLQYMGEDPEFNYGIPSNSPSDNFVRTKEIYDGSGNLKQTQKTTPSKSTQIREELQNQQLMEKVSDDFMTRFPFNKNRR